MAVHRPTPQQLQAVANRLNLSLTDADVRSFLGLFQGQIDADNRVDQLPDNLPPVRYARTPGVRPLPEHNPSNAWYGKSTVATGPLAGMPAWFCGIDGMTPTHGLVPDTGVMPIEVTVDHGGPMTATVRDNALLLEVIAGARGDDPRQFDVRTQPYTAALGQGIAGRRIGVVQEGFMQGNAEAVVNQKVMAAAGQLRALGGIVTEESMPMHLIAGAIATPIVVEGTTQTMLHGDGCGTAGVTCTSPA